MTAGPFTISCMESAVLYSYHWLLDSQWQPSSDVII